MLNKGLHFYHLINLIYPQASERIHISTAFHVKFQMNFKKTHISRISLPTMITLVPQLCRTWCGASPLIIKQILYITRYIVWQSSCVTLLVDCSPSAHMWWGLDWSHVKTEITLRKCKVVWPNVILWAFSLRLYCL